jgi:hypothetical protein
MPKKSIKVLLLVEDNVGDAHLRREMELSIYPIPFHIWTVLRSRSACVLKGMLGQ